MVLCTFFKFSFSNEFSTVLVDPCCSVWHRAQRSVIKRTIYADKFLMSHFSAKCKVIILPCIRHVFQRLSLSPSLFVLNKGDR
jgi:hypothetical protein